MKHYCFANILLFAAYHYQYKGNSMSVLKWSDEEMSVGVEVLDNDHKKILALLNRLEEAIESGKEDLVMEDTFRELISYIINHFKREEDFLENSDYPELALHKKSHDALSARLVKVMTAYEKGDNEAPQMLLKIMSDWFMKHILITDMKYSSYISR